MIGVDRWIEAELCDGLVNVIRQIKTVLERADPLEVRVFVE
jgi:hypothetical protein